MSDEWLGGEDPVGRCFGCGQGNPLGLRLRFRRTGPGTVEGVYEAPEHQAGAPGVVHGGIQAALLDETLGFAVQAARGSDEPDFDIVTVEFTLRYKRPAPTGAPLVLRGRFVRSEGRDYWVAGEIVDESGGVLTEGEARWRRIGG
jgi:acyl-coenzyme A thioesterase PaaI-like protein